MIRADDTRPFEGDRVQKKSNDGLYLNIESPINPFRITVGPTGELWLVTQEYKLYSLFE